MKIKFTRGSSSVHGDFNVGAIVDIPDKDARKFCRSGAAMRVKSEVKFKPRTKAEPKKHKHSYRKDGTCACGKIRKANKE